MKYMSLGLHLVTLLPSHQLTRLSRIDIRTPIWKHDLINPPQYYKLEIICLLHRIRRMTQPMPPDRR